MTKQRRRGPAPATPSEPPGFPSWLSRDVVLLDGRTVFVRPVLPTDVDELRRAIAHADPATVRSRFLGGRPPIGEKELGRLVNLDYDRRLAVLALSPVGRGIGIARYEAESGADIAEVAVAVDPAWRHIGVASALVRLLAAEAVRKGIHRFSADFFDANQDVRDLFAEAGLSYQTSPAASGVVTAEVTLPTDPADLL